MKVVTATLDSVYLVYLGQYLNSIQEEFLDETSQATI
jgi:hypothetical protein